MHPPYPPSGRRFTPAAREAGLAVRRAKALMRDEIDLPKVFVVRFESHATPFGWEIRRFGGVVLERSDVGFASIMLAQDAGAKALPQRSST